VDWRKKTFTKGKNKGMARGGHTLFLRHQRMPRREIKRKRKGVKTEESPPVNDQWLWRLLFR